MILTTQEIQNNLIQNAYHRELEIYTYQVNIDNYTAMLTQLPQGDWDSDIEQYKMTSIIDMPAAVTDADVERVSSFQYRDQLRKVLRTEKAEQSKSIHILNAFKSQITGDYDQLIATYKQSVV